jgi:Holliday junction resolvase RusA-like endonuclease
MITQLSFELPFPLRGLSPNSRLSWRAKASVTARYREMCGWAAKEAMQQHGLKGPLHPPVVAEVTFELPDRRRRDEDNLKASMKAAWDGLVDAGLLVDDDIARFRVVVLGAEYAGVATAGGGRLVGAVKVTLKSG